MVIRVGWPPSSRLAAGAADSSDQRAKASTTGHSVVTGGASASPSGRADTRKGQGAPQAPSTMGGSASYFTPSWVNRSRQALSSAGMSLGDAGAPAAGPRPCGVEPLGGLGGDLRGS